MTYELQQSIKKLKAEISLRAWADHAAVAGHGSAKRERAGRMKQTLGLNDSLWLGYWMGGSTALAIAVLGADISPFLLLMLWVTLTPVGIFIAKSLGKRLNV